jgi:hypothetical protein
MRKNIFFTDTTLSMVLSAFAGVQKAFCIGDSKEIKKIITEQAPERDKFELEFPVVSYTSESLKDPFQGMVIEEPENDKPEDIPAIESISLPNITVQGIIWGTNNPQAIINDKVVKVGSTINDITILDITGTEIIISYKNQKFALPAPSGIKTPDVKLKGGTHGR